MATRESIAVVGIKNPENSKEVSLLMNIIIRDMTLNALIFPSPNPTLVSMTAQNVIIKDLISAVDSGDRTKVSLRNEASRLGYRMMKQQTIYVNQVANGDRGIQEMSGFPVNAQPAPRPAPAKVEISKIEQGIHPKTAKVFIHNMKMSPLTYNLQTTLTPDVEDSWKTVITTTNSRSLLLTDLIHGQEFWIRISASNVHGQGQWSETVSYICQN